MAKRQSMIGSFFKPKEPTPQKRKAEESSPLTPAQKKRMEENRKLAMMRKTAKLEGKKLPTLKKDFLTLPGSWAKVLEKEPRKGYFQRLRKMLEAEYASKTVFPPRDLLFEALKRCDFDDVRVVIVGQDPYHGPGQAHGLCFSVQNGVRIPPSLRNIYKELKTDTKGVFVPPSHGNLTAWADQGVLLLNTVLTVRKSEAYSHRKKGWEEFTDAIIRALNDKKEDLVFLCWGKPAAAKVKLVSTRKHKILKSSHPSPLGATKTSSPFIGCRHFTKTNAFLESKGKGKIEWQL